METDDSQITSGGIVKPAITREEYTLGKVREMTEGKRVIMSDDELDLLAKFDVSNLIRSIPNKNQIGTLDRWECWIEQRDLKRFNANVV